MSEGDVIKELPFTYVLLSDHTVVASFCIKPYEEDAAYATPVSYTHLDVYKRQAISCVSWGWRILL